MQYDLKTQAIPDGKILQELSQIVNDQTETLSRWLLNTQDEGVRAALIDLGWTPPVVRTIRALTDKERDEYPHADNVYIERCGCEHLFDPVMIGRIPTPAPVPNGKGIRIQVKQCERHRPVNIGIEIATDADGAVLWIERYVLKRAHGPGETFIREYKEYRVLKSVFTRGSHDAGLVEHVVELIADRTPATDLRGKLADKVVDEQVAMRREQRIFDLEAELRVTEELLRAREEVLRAIPDCNAHGACIPSALEWIERAKQYEAAIRKHRGRKADDRCHLDDQELYAVLGDGNLGDNRIGDPEAMLANRKRFIEQRCAPGGWPTYADLETRIAELEGDLKYVRKELESALGDCGFDITEAQSAVEYTRIARRLLRHWPTLVPAEVQTGKIPQGNE